MSNLCVTLRECVCVKRETYVKREQLCYYIVLNVVQPGGNKWVTLGGAAEALFALGQGGIQEQVSVGQHGQYRSLRALGHLHT